MVILTDYEIKSLRFACFCCVAIAMLLGAVIGVGIVAALFGQIGLSVIAAWASVILSCVCIGIGWSGRNIIATAESEMTDGQREV